VQGSNTARLISLPRTTRRGSSRRDFLDDEPPLDAPPRGDLHSDRQNLAPGTPLA
jgi:hypothetical protein